MPTTTLEKNYSKCPLKKRPVHFIFDESEIKDEPENLCIKKEPNNYPDKLSDNSYLIESDDEKSPSSTVIVPTPTYPKFNLHQPWNFHLPYSTDFYKTLSTQNNHYYHMHHHHHHQVPQQQQSISPLRGDLHSPSSPSENSMSPPPPHYLHGRASSVSPPIREMYHNHNNHHHNAISTSRHNSHIIKPEVIPQHRFMPYQIPYQPYALSLNNNNSINNNNQQPPISPSYSDTSSYYSMRSQTPESNCSIPEDLSLKQSPKHLLSSLTPTLSISSSSPSLSSSSPSIVSNFTNHENRDMNFPTTTKRHNNGESNNNNKEKISPPRYQCPDCNKSYSTFSGLTKHQQFHCPAAEGNQIKKSFSCKDCDKTYVSLGALKMHIRTHTLPCKCTICGKAFSRPWLLQGHIRTHTGEKPFSCQHCHRAFADRSNLRAHLQTHSDIKKYSCTTCSKTFSRMSLLTKHNEGGCPGIHGSSSPNYIPQFQEH